MINILYENFPDSIIVGNKVYKIVTDFREWLKFADMVSDDSIPAEWKIGFMANWIISPPDIITAEIVDALRQFYTAADIEYIRCPESEEDTEQIERPPVFDWRIDARYVLGDFRRFYSIDLLRTEYLHWWEFRSLFSALPDESQCKTIIGYRSVNLSEIKNESERTRIRKIQQKLALPFEYTDEGIGDIFDDIM